MCLAKVVMVTTQASQNKEFLTTEQWSSSRSYFDSDDRSPPERLYDLYFKDSANIKTGYLYKLVTSQINIEKKSSKIFDQCSS